MKRGGGAYKEQKKYAGINDYLEAKHPKLYELISNVGVKSRLIAKGRTLVTFILPESSTVDKLVTLAKGSGPGDNDIETVVEALCAHIILGLYRSADDFADRKDDITNASGKKLEIKEVKSGKVVLKNGSELSVCGDFHQIATNGRYPTDNSAVWCVKGPIDTEGPDSDFTYTAERPKERDTKSAKTGGDDSEQALITKNLQHADSIGIDYERSQQTVCRALNYWMLNQEKHKECLLTARAMFGPNMFYNCFILLRVPKLFAPSAVAEAIDNGLDDRNYTNFRKFCAEGISDGTAVCDRSSSAWRRFEDRVISLARSAKSPAEKAKDILSYYNDADTKNAIGPLSNIYPQHLHALFAANPGMHLCIDEVRYNLFTMHPDVYAASVNAIQDEKMPAQEIYRRTVAMYRGLTFSDTPCVGFFRTVAENPLSFRGDISPKLQDFVEKGFVLACGAAKHGGDDSDSDDHVETADEAADEVTEDVYDRNNADGDDSEFKLSDSCITEIKAFLAKHDKSELEKMLE